MSATTLRSAQQTSRFGSAKDVEAYLGQHSSTINLAAEVLKIAATRFQGQSIGISEVSQKVTEVMPEILRSLNKERDSLRSIERNLTMALEAYLRQKKS